MMGDDDVQLGLATEVTVAWLSNRHTRAEAEDVSAMLRSVLSALRGLGVPASAEPAERTAATEYTRAVTVRKSLASPNRIVSMIDGKPYGSLKRHLTAHGLTADEYRKRYGLKPDYPMVAPGYSEQRRAVAKQHNFGRPNAETPAAQEEAQTQEPTAPEPAGAATFVAAQSPLTKPAKTVERRRLGIASARQAAQAHLGAEDGGSASNAPTKS